MSGGLPKPSVKIIDLQHNLIPLETGLGLGNHSNNHNNNPGIASSTGSQIMGTEGLSRADSTNFKN